MLPFVKSAFVVLAALAITAVPASADTGARAYSVKVAHGDLNLDSEQGALTAMHRIERAASQACGARPHLAQLKAGNSYRACVAEVTQKAVEAIGAPVLLALHARTTPITLASR